MEKNPDIQFRSPEEIKLYQEARLTETLAYLQAHSQVVGTAAADPDRSGGAYPLKPSQTGKTRGETMRLSPRQRFPMIEICREIIVIGIETFISIILITVAHQRIHTMLADIHPE